MASKRFMLSAASDGEAAYHGEGPAIVSHDLGAVRPENRDFQAPRNESEEDLG
jgi:hypothetical protein